VETDPTPSNPDHIRELRRGDPTLPAALARDWPADIPALYVQGEWPVPGCAIAIVGTTTPTPPAQRWAFDFAAEAATRGWVVVSGLARGIDAAAHLGALSVGGRTVAVVADGHDVIYPVEHQALARRMVRSGGAVVSISPAGTHGGRHGLLLRNRITSALSLVAVTVQSRAWDGAMATLRHAYRQGKVIAALVPLDGTDHLQWRGNDLLLGTRAPWREHQQEWTPAVPIWPEQGIGAFLDDIERVPEPLDGQSYRPETPRETQARLLEIAAPYRP
jgi:DNA protecting protein DprA